MCTHYKDDIQNKNCGYLNVMLCVFLMFITGKIYKNYIDERTVLYPMTSKSINLYLTVFEFSYMNFSF